MTKAKINNIGILTSGGDAPGMNAAIHAIVTTAEYHNINCVGFERGYNGLIDDTHIKLNNHNVKHISQLGGTILKSARCDRMLESDMRQIAVNNMKQLELDGLIVIGGDGSFRGATELSKITDIPIIGAPGTIDNDIDGSDYTIGFFTAADTALDAIDKIRDTADAFERIFIVEVMGRHSGHLALEVGVAAEAEHIICPEMNIAPESIVQSIATHVNNHLAVYGDSSYIIVVAEHTYEQGSEALAKMLTEQIGIETRASILGHIQRGGIASCQDRTLATKLGGFAVETLINGKHSVMVGEVKGQLTLTDLNKTGLGLKQPNQYLLNLYRQKLAM